VRCDGIRSTSSKDCSTSRARRMALRQIARSADRRSEHCGSSDASTPINLRVRHRAPLSDDGSNIRKLTARTDREAALSFPTHPHMLRQACGYKLANDGHDTRAIQDYPAAPEHHAHDSIHGARERSVQRLLAYLARRTSTALQQSARQALRLHPVRLRLISRARRELFVQIRMHVELA